MIFLTLAEPQEGGAQEGAYGGESGYESQSSVSVTYTSDGHRSVGSGSTSYLKVIPYSEKKYYYRGEIVEISYHIISVSAESIKIKIPDEFMDLEIEEPILENNYSLKDNFILLELGDDLNTTNYLKYRARIRIDANIDSNFGIIDIGKDSFILPVNVHESYLPSYEITLANNKPQLYSTLDRSNELNKKGLPDLNILENKSYELFRDENANIIFYGNDPEDSNLSYMIYTIEDNSPRLIKNGYLNNKKIQDNESIQLTSKENIKLLFKLLDKDGGYIENTYLINRKSDTISDYMANQVKYSLCAVIIILFVIMFIKRYQEKHARKLLLALLIFPIIIFISSKLFENTFGFFRELAYLEVLIYFITFIFFALFIQSNFASKEYKIREYKLQTESFLWFMSAISMGIITLIFIFVLPTSGIFGDNANESDRFNYIFWYYSMMPQTFGAILAVVVAFTGWYLAENNIASGDKEVFKSKIKNFIILYMSIIVLSVIGLVNGTVPPLGNLIYAVSSYSEVISILTFQCTLLLMIPAFAGLYELAKWTMDLNNKDDSDKKGDF